MNFILKSVLLFSASVQKKLHKTALFFIVLLSTWSLHAQISFNIPPKQQPDTLYFPYKNDVQLILIDNFDSYSRYGAWYDAVYPRGGSWFMDHRPVPKNVYIFRDKAGKIVRIYNADSIDVNSLKSTTFINTNALSLNQIYDYVQLNQHLKFYGENKQVGLINLMGEIVVPAIYDDIRKYQDMNKKRDKLIVIQDNKFGFLDANLKLLFPPMYRAHADSNYIGYPEHNIIDSKNIKVYKADKCGLISEEGEVLIDFMFDEIRVIHDNLYIGLIHRAQSEISHSLKNHWNWGYQVKNCFIFDSDFKILTKLEDFEYIYYYGIKSFIVKKDAKFGVVNELGEIVVPFEYDLLSAENGVYHVSKNNKCGVLNLEGKLVIPVEHERIQFYGQAIYVTQNGLIGVYSLDFRLISPPQYQYKNWDMGKFILTRKDGSKGFVKHDKEDSYYQSPEGGKVML